MLNAIERKQLLGAATRRRRRPATSFDAHGASLAIGAALRACRKSRSLTLAQVAERLGTHRPIVGRVERGRHLPKPLLLAKHMACVGMPMRSLLVIVHAMERA